MKLNQMKIVEVEQGSPEWLESRKLKVTGSRVGTILGHLPYQTPEELMEEMVEEACGKPLPPPNKAMKWGSKHEKTAARTFHKITSSPLKHVGQVVHPTYDWIRYSPDGLILNGGISHTGVPTGDTVVGLLEIKCPYSGKIPPHPPPYYLDQVMLGAHLLGVEEISFVYWTPEGVKIWNIEREEEWWEREFPVMEQFYEDLINRYQLLKGE